MRRMVWILVGCLVFSGAAMAGIDGSKHDLGTYDGTTARICIFCHYPHNALTTKDAPLWNHNDSTVESYTMYDGGASGTLNATIDALTGSTGALSNLCLSCHDGSIALGSILKGSVTNTSTKMTGVYNVGTDLSNDHPINFTYDSTVMLADGELKDPGALSGVQLFSNKVQCASCHDVHDNQYGKFLITDNTGSAMCLKCHDK